MKRCTRYVFIDVDYYIGVLTILVTPELERHRNKMWCFANVICQRSIGMEPYTSRRWHLLFELHDLLRYGAWTLSFGNTMDRGSFTVDAHGNAARIMLLDAPHFSLRSFE